jgi:Ca2+-transporting ATPase
MFEGISTEKAKSLLREYGYNELPASKPKNVWNIALETVREPMFILLLSCGTLYLLLGDYTEGITLLCWIFLIVFITFIQYRKTEKSLDALRQLSSPRALVIRDGRELRIAGREVVPGDVIKLHEGDRVPADGMLLECSNLKIDESLLTGESASVQKSSDTNDMNLQVYSGTLVVFGRGLFTATHTGTSTMIGKIGKSLQTIQQDHTQLQMEMKRVVRNLFMGGAIISLGVMIAFYLTRGHLLNAILTGLSSAMALLPEEFPLVLTIFLAMGAWRLAGNKVLTRKPSAIETLGSATVLCSDKTGTITQNKMDIAALYHSGTSYTREEISSNRNALHSLLSNLALASHVHSIDPMEKAIMLMAPPTDTTANCIREYSISKETFAMSRAIRYKDNPNLVIYCKGAPETVLGMCNLAPDEHQAIAAAISDYAQRGYRILAAARCEWTEHELPEKQSDFPFIFSGLVGFEDPIRPEVPMAIKECYDAGVDVIMITGDYPETALSIAKQIGIKHKDHVLTGTELKHISQDELTERIGFTKVFARIIPEQKLQLIHALKSKGEIVAMTGDGVNDAPALKAADIGIAMGLKGTDVAREASSLVLLDDHFASIVHAIRLGRRIYDNLQKAISYIVAIHIPIVGLVLLPAFISSLPVLLMPLHIVFMELIIDPVCSIAFESEQEEQGIMNRPPRNPDVHFFGYRNLLFSLLKGLLLLIIVLIVYFLSIEEGHTSDEVRAISFSTLIIGNVFLILTSLSESRGVVSIIRERNKPLLFIAFTALILLLLTINIPVLMRLFNFGFPGYSHFISSVAGAGLMLIILEVYKKYKHRKLLRISH